MKRPRIVKLAFLSATGAVTMGIVAMVIAQPPPARMHRITQKGELNIRPATSTPDIANEVKVEIIGDQRVITSNGIPNHSTGQFPNNGNPNRIKSQSHVYRVPANPRIADRPTAMRGEFGVAVNGVPFDPGAGEFYAGEPGWQYEPLSGAIDLGIDVSHAHVQPTGKYHYHGLPTGLIDSVKVDANAHSPLIGWAADGFPMYAVYGFEDPKDQESAIIQLMSSYRLKAGDRPGGNAPGGSYDGTFVRDYEFVEGSGDLDECNGRFTVTPEFPNGTYAYFMTEQWPVVPRMYRGTPSNDFRHGPPSGGGFGGGGIGGRFSGGRMPRFGGERGRSDTFIRDRETGPQDRRRAGAVHLGPPKPGILLPDLVRESLQLSGEQSAELDDLQSMVDAELAKILTAEQLERIKHGPH